VEIDFYYNSPSDDPYGGRNYSDAAFVSGDLAPVVLRDTRILECSTRVENVAYIHDIYYSPSTYSRFGIYQPYRHYTGHSSFGFGFGSNYFGPGINFFNNNRSRFGRNNFTNNGRSFLPRTNLPNGGFRGSSVRRGLVSPLRTRIATGNTNANAVGTNTQTEISPTTQPATPNNTVLRRREALSRIGAGGRNLTETNLRSPRRATTAAPTTSPTASAPNSVSSRQSLVRSRIQNSAANQRIQKQNATPRTPTQSVPKTNTSKNNTSKRASSSRSNSSSSKRNSFSRPNSSSRSSRSNTSSRSSFSSRGASSRLSTPSRSSSIRSRRLNFFPNDGFGGRDIVTSRGVDCAREDRLSVFIPNDRLDAARFDGLTLIALDAQGGETPIYIPPNYIQGYRLAETGRVQPQGISPAPQHPAQPQFQQPGFQQPQFQQPGFQQPQFPQQGPLIEPAPCPAGTLKQPNGTCLQTSTTGYPTR